MPSVVEVWLVCGGDVEGDGLSGSDLAGHFNDDFEY
jgi:hypothetical protein